MCCSHRQEKQLVSEGLTTREKLCKPRLRRTPIQSGGPTDQQRSLPAISGCLFFEPLSAVRSVGRSASCGQQNAASRNSSGPCRRKICVAFALRTGGGNVVQSRPVHAQLSFRIECPTGTQFRRRDIPGSDQYV